MNSGAKLLRVVARLPAKRNVSAIRPRGESVVYNGQTYTKMLYPHTMTAIAANHPWKIYWKYNHWFRMIVYSTILIGPIAFYLNAKSEFSFSI